jgi:hypothetical protein
MGRNPDRCRELAALVAVRLRRFGPDDWIKYARGKGEFSRPSTELNFTFAKLFGAYRMKQKTL